MALFAPRCDRCGNRTRNEEEDKPVCPECVQEMALMLEASQETERACPVDGAKMAKEVAHMLVIDRCPSCNGVWMDGGEVERIKGELQEVAVMAMTRGLSGPVF